ncbi:DUF4329 domain-containing protein [Erythrobacter sp. JK5]|uniref:DUF4329 domain-containing protein n=1 Tax=Erythrobacter sp. JK5 TaxID=2829500 RepID=UPI001BA44432|nr:DUF4329 domain-containing protein [Erythrobacter sp. JK5]QUL38833.1 DUF4329 domain-containing protein [Erythrobacter sp. JK5]
METSRNTALIFGACAIAWVVIVARAYTNVKGPEDFVVTVSQPEVQAFARDQLGALQKRSFAEDVELCAIIFEDSEGKLGSTPVRVGAEASCDIAYFDEPGMAPVASFHTHGSFGEEYDNEVPSLTDIQSDIGSGMDGYVSTPGGRLWWIDWRGERAVEVCGEGCLEQDPDYRPCPGDRINREFSLTQLVARNDSVAADC